jgi:hypothetical protein
MGSTESKTSDVLQLPLLDDLIHERGIKFPKNFIFLKDNESKLKDKDLEKKIKKFGLLDHIKLGSPLY